MICRSKRHAWNDPTSAKRCCDPEWMRQIRVTGDHDDLDPDGRVYTADGFVFGWFKVPDHVVVHLDVHDLGHRKGDPDCELI